MCRRTSTKMSPSSSRTAAGSKSPRSGARASPRLPVPIGEELTAGRMFHVLKLTPALASLRDTSVPLSRTRHSLESVVQERRCSVHAAAAPAARRLCCVKVKLTMRFAAAAGAAMCRAFPLRRFSPCSGEAYTGGVKQTGQRGAGRGGETHTSRSAKGHRSKGGCSQHPPFDVFGQTPQKRAHARLRAHIKSASTRVFQHQSAFTRVLSKHYAIVHLHRRQRRLSQPCRLGTLLKVRFALELPQHPTQDDPPRAPAELPPDTPREPILTLPAGADRLYRCCSRSSICACCCRRSGRTGPSTCSASFRKRYDSTLLDVTYSRRRRRQGLDLRHLLAAARQSHPYRLQRAVAVAVRQRAGAAVRRVALLSVHGGDGGGRRARASRHPRACAWRR